MVGEEGIMCKQLVFLCHSRLNTRAITIGLFMNSGFVIGMLWFTSNEEAQFVFMQLQWNQ